MTIIIILITQLQIISSFFSFNTSTHTLISRHVVAPCMIVSAHVWWDDRRTIIEAKSRVDSFPHNYIRLSNAAQLIAIGAAMGNYILNFIINVGNGSRATWNLINRLRYLDKFFLSFFLFIRVFLPPHLICCACIFNIFIIFKWLFNYSTGNLRLNSFILHKLND